MDTRISKMLVCGISVVLVALTVAPAQASIHNDFDPLNSFLEQGDTLTGHFDLRGSELEGDIGDVGNFVVGQDGAFFGLATFGFADDSDAQYFDFGTEKAEISLDNSSEGTFTVGAFGGGSIKIFLLDFGDLDAINGTGKLGWTIQSTKGDFYVKGANLLVKAEALPQSGNVPEPGSLLVWSLIAGLGITATRRRLAI